MRDLSEIRAAEVTLVVLAGGLGTRFGGDKQLAAVGPRGETFFDYAIHDAASAGVSRFVMAIRSDIEQVITEHLARFHPDRDIVLVRNEDRGPKRPTPWGTAHALLVATDHIRGPFVAVNADDYYGPDSYIEVARLLAINRDPKSGAIVGFELQTARPSAVAVSQGIITTNQRGHFRSIQETIGFDLLTNGDYSSRQPEGRHPANTLVSKNMWGLPNRALDSLPERYVEFVQKSPATPNQEFAIADVVTNLVRDNELSLSVLRSPETCIGATHPDDIPAVQAHIERRADTISSEGSVDRCV